MAARPKNNLNEHVRRIGGTPTPPARVMPASPLATGTKSKFKVSKSLTSSTPSSIPVRPPSSLLTPGADRTKAAPQVASSSSVADASNLSIISVSSTDSAALNASTSSIPSKRVSSGSPADLFLDSPPKRPKTDHVPNKENRFPVNPVSYANGRARNRTEPDQSSSTVVPSSSSATSPIVPTHPSHNVQGTLPAASLYAALKALPHDAGLEEMPEEELRGVCSTSDSLLEWCNKQIGAARADAGDPRDVAFCNILADFAEKRLTSARSLLRALQRGERQPVNKLNSSIANPSVATSSARPSGISAPSYQQTTAATHVEERTSVHWSNERCRVGGAADTGFDDDEYWGSDDGFLEMVDSVPAALPSRPDPPVNEHRSSPIVQEVSTPITRFGNPPTTKPTDTTELEDKPYYPRVKEALTKVFRLQSFRTLQLEVICDVMEGLDVFVLFPTGSGKSLTFQLPAVCQDGMTIVVSPLKSLILDQHRALRALGVDVEMLLGEMADSQRKEVWRRLGSGHVPKLLYLTPERLEMDGMRSLLQRLQSSGSLARFVIDEAHLITDWGRSFRDAYVQLNTLRTAYPGVPISALTATASPEVQGDIITRLHLKIHAPWKLSANRPNLDYDVRPKTKNVLSEIADFIKNNYPRETGIIYCSSRDKCEEVAKVLRDKFQLSAKHYHAGMADQDKAQVQEEWSSGRIRIIVATIAFGMGIDKPDVRYVIHHSLPNSLNGYYQETGRGGRDGKPAQCILYYSTADFYNRLRMIRGNPPSQMRDAEEDDIRRVMGYVTNDVQCRRAQVLAFFHEDFDPVHCRQMCNNCRDNTPCVTEDHTADAQKALRLFESLSRRPRARLTPPQFIAALKGSKAQMQVERGWTNDPLHGSCSHLSNDVLARLIDQMLWHNFLSIEQVRGSKDGYCQNYLTLGPEADALRRGKQLMLSFRAGRKGGAKGLRKADSSRPVPDAVMDDVPSAGPSSSGPSAGPSRRGASSGPSSSGGLPPSVSTRPRTKNTFAPTRNISLAEAPVAPELSLWRDDPEDDDPDFVDDEIEDISSPPPPRRVGTRGMPSASQSMADGYTSEIEEDPAPYRVTMIRQEDLHVEEEEADVGGGDTDVPMRCRAELLRLRDEIIEEDESMEHVLSTDIIELLACTLPNDLQSLRASLEEEGVQIQLVKRHCPRILSICSKYHMLLR